jgi:hypothetical protein
VPAADQTDQTAQLDDGEQAALIAYHLQREMSHARAA